MMLGAGRERLDSKIDHAAGIILKKKIGDPVSEGETLCMLEYNDNTNLTNAVTCIEQAYGIGDTQPPRVPLIKQIVTGPKI
jgi:thymidine phosphorylase